MRWTALALGTWISACTLLNTYDPVRTAAPTDASIDIADVAADAAPQPARGAIVIGGVIESDNGSQSVLTALDPNTGAELPRAREPMNVAAVVFDGLRDLWYVFESGGTGFIPTPTDEVFLHIRELDTVSGAWTEHAKIDVPPELSFATMAALRERIGYITYNAGGNDAGAYDFVSIDTTSPDAPHLGDRRPIGGAPVGAMGTRSNTAAGGVINFIERGTCGDAGACIQFVRALVPPTAETKLTNVTPATTTGGVVPYGGGPTFAHVQTTGLDVVGSRTGPQATVHFFQPLNGQPVASPISFDMGGSTLKPLAVAECQGILLAVETNTDLLVHAVPLAANGAPATITMNHSGQGVYFEPYTSTVLTPFSQGPGYEITAFTLSGSSTAPALARRVPPAWAPPSELRPQIVAVRTPVDFACE